MGSWASVPPKFRQALLELPLSRAASSSCACSEPARCPCESGRQRKGPLLLLSVQPPTAPQEIALKHSDWKQPLDLAHSCKVRAPWGSGPWGHTHLTWLPHRRACCLPAPSLPLHSAPRPLGPLPVALAPYTRKRASSHKAGLRKGRLKSKLSKRRRGASLTSPGLPLLHAIDQGRQ